MLIRFALLTALLFAHALGAQQVIPQLDKSKPPADRPVKAPSREKIDPKDYPCYTAEKFTEGPAATWLKDLKPEVIEGDVTKMKNPKVNPNWMGEATLKYESIVNVNKVALAHGISRATWNSTGKLYAQGNWRDSKRHGVWKFYDEMGVLIEIECYQEDKLDGPYAEFSNGALHRWGTCVDGKFDGEFCQFHKDGWLHYRTQWVVVDGMQFKEVERSYNASGQLTHQWNFVKAKVDGDQISWVEPWLDKDGKQGNPTTAGRLQIVFTNEKFQYHGWQSYYHQKQGYRQYDTWYEHGEQTGPFLSYNAEGKQISGGMKTKGVSTGAWWELDEAGNRTEFSYNDKGEIEGAYLKVDPKGNQIAKGRVKAGLKVGTWVHAYETYTETFTFAEDGSGVHGPYSSVTTDGRVKSKGTYEKGKRTGSWTMSDLPWEVEETYFTNSGDQIWRGEGDFHNNARSGKWVWKRDDGTLAAEGAYDATFRDGTWTFYHADGKTLAGQGSYALNLMSGDWVFHYANGQKWGEGAYRAGKETGPWVTYFETGTKSSEGTYQDGGCVGDWRYYHPNGKLKQKGKYIIGQKFTKYVESVRVGEWEDFNEQGELTLKTFFADTSPETVRGTTEREAPLDKTPEGVTIDPALANGTWATYRGTGITRVLESRIVAVNGQPAGKAQQYWPNGKLGAEGLLYGDKREGLWKYWYESGVLKEEGTFVEGALRGPTKSWRTDGTLSSAGNFEAGKRLGSWTTYYPDGKQPQREATYGANEQYDGPLTDYYANGQVQLKGSYAAGKQDGEWHSFFESGAKRYVVNYKAGKLEGRYQTWLENGKPEKDYTYLNGQFDGEYQTWHKNGQLASKGTFKAGLKSVSWQEWYENGQLKLEQTFDEAGNTTSAKAWNEDGTEKK